VPSLRAWAPCGGADAPGERGRRRCEGRGRCRVVESAAFSLFLLRKHFITEKILKKKSGDVNDEANFSFFILNHKRANPILPPYLLPHLRARTQTLYRPPTHPSSCTSHTTHRARTQNPTHHPKNPSVKSILKISLIHKQYKRDLKKRRFINI